MRNTPAHSVMLSLVLLLGSTLPGCIIHENDDWFDDDDYCYSDLDCGSGESCRDNCCYEVPDDSTSCHSSRDCDKGKVCVNNVCYSPCARDTDCGSGNKCADHFCVPNTSRPDSGTVDAGTPRTDGGTDAGTRTDGGTDAGTRPDAGSSTTCRLNADCGTGNYCINNTCYHGCSTDAQCSSTDACVAGVCRARPPDPTACTSGYQ
jgi:hypothetical protein